MKKYSEAMLKARYESEAYLDLIEVEKIEERDNPNLGGSIFDLSYRTRFSIDYERSSSGSDDVLLDEERCTDLIDEISEGDVLLYYQESRNKSTGIYNIEEDEENGEFNFEAVWEKNGKGFLDEAFQNESPLLN